MLAVLRSAANAVPVGVGLGRRRAARAAFLASAALISALSASSGALAQCVNSNFNFGGAIFTPNGNRNIIPTASPLVSIMNTVNTAFLTNTTSFVSAPAGPQPDQPSGGIWARTIVGFVDSTTNSASAVGPFLLPGIFVGDPPFPATGTQKCLQTNHQDYAGIQIGTDIAKLNIGSSGANWHFGVTAGFFDARTKDTTPAGVDYAGGDLRSHFEVPFVGVYTAITQGNFFADAQVRWDFYQNTSSSKIQDFRDVQNEARGISVTSSIGYRIALVSNWFIEPALGASWSRVKIDPVTFADADGVGGIVRVNDIDSILGRASLRVGTNVTQGIYTWQPFVSASAIHEFAGNVTSSVQIVDPSGFFPGVVFNTSTERMGTYGQFGLGTAIVVGDTGWLGYGRADVKVGENVQGMGFNVGLRYQW